MPSWASSCECVSALAMSRSRSSARSESASRTRCTEKSAKSARRAPVLSRSRSESARSSGDPGSPRGRRGSLVSRRGLRSMRSSRRCPSIGTARGRSDRATPHIYGILSTSTPIMSEALTAALALLVGLDAKLIEIVFLSLRVSLSAVAIAALMGLPIGAAIAVGRFPGRQTVIVVLNALMGLPPVVVGLLVYLLLSRAGPLGALGILFTPSAMVVAQTILILPIIAALSRQAIEDAWREYEEQLRSLGAGRMNAALTLLWDTRFSLLTPILAGFGRAAAEVGAVMIVGGNIDGVTRVMTTTIALETSKGDLPLALGLGIILLAIVIAVNAAAYLTKELAQRRYG